MRDGTSQPSSLFAHGQYRVEAVGAECPLVVGEVVTHRRSLIDFLSGDPHPVEMEVVRESGDCVTLAYGPTGARLTKVEA